jgi:TRAP-type C4-dicarboxylate transport system substrate-binding protein
MKKIVLTAVVTLLFFPALVFAQRRSNQLIIHMASPIPANTAWGEKLNEISVEWARITNNEVRLVIHPNGSLGTESAVIQQLDNGALDAAVLSSFGLNMITKKTQNIITRAPVPSSTSIITLSYPFLIRTEEELDLVMSGLKADLEATINSKGYFTLAWARVGWAKIFSRSPVFTPSDLRAKNQFIGTGEGEDEIKTAFERMGLNMRVVNQKDILQALTTRTITAVYQSPIAAGGAQIVGVAPNMMDLNVAPFMGGIIFNQNSWDKIPQQYKQELLRATKRIEAELDRAVKNLETEALAQISSRMRGRFVINRLTPAQEQEWYSLVDATLPPLIGTTFDRDIYNKIDAIVKAYRNRR